MCVLKLFDDDDDDESWAQNKNAKNKTQKFIFRTFLNIIFIKKTLLC